MNSNGGRRSYSSIVTEGLERAVKSKRFVTWAAPGLGVFSLLSLGIVVFVDDTVSRVANLVAFVAVDAVALFIWRQRRWWDERISWWQERIT